MTMFDRGVTGLVADLRDTLDEYATPLKDADDNDTSAIDIGLDSLRDEFLLELVAVAKRHGATDE